jgi:hypothetical protein
LPLDFHQSILIIGECKAWTLQRPFFSLRHEYALVRMLRNLKTGQLAQLDCPEEVPAVIWTHIKDCLSADVQARPTANILLANFQTLFACSGVFDHK